MSSAKRSFASALAGIFWLATVPFAQAKESAATIINGVNPAGIKRVNNLDNLEKLLNMLASSAEIIGVIVGIYFLFQAVKLFSKSKTQSILKALTGIAFISTGLLTPGFIDWLVCCARDSHCGCY